LSSSSPAGARARWAPGTEVLAAATQAIAAVSARGQSAEQALAPFEDHDRRAAIRAITLGSLRWSLRLWPAIESLLVRQRLASELRALLVAAAHQVEYSRNAPQASVHIAVDAARALGHERASGLVNAVLRRFVTERLTLFARLDLDLGVASAHPGWLVAALREAWPAQIEAILAANNAHPPLVLRIDRSRLTREDYLRELQACDIGARAVPWAPDAIELDRPRSVEAIPGFTEGRVSVQDAGAQLAAPLLDARAGMRVLDCCAAPGGKALHVLEYAPELGELLAIDVDPERLVRLQENLQRAGRAARVAALDARADDPLLGDSLFDRVIVDAPCSSTGVIRRHPDIKLLRRATDIAGLSEAQLELLQAAFRRLRPGGRLLYCTCSLLPQENEGVVQRFLQGQSTARVAPMPRAADLAPGALERSVGVQLLPGGDAGTDGFYYACLEKTTAGP
jgi:16S rRNA (cytosine967-C5)-methyltransferase